MRISRSLTRSFAALVAALALTALTAGAAFAHPESEGEHGGCIVGEVAHTKKAARQRR